MKEKPAGTGKNEHKKEKKAEETRSVGPAQRGRGEKAKEGQQRCKRKREESSSEMENNPDDDVKDSEEEEKRCFGTRMLKHVCMMTLRKMHYGFW